jgi:hypothetical protein
MCMLAYSQAFVGHVDTGIGTLARYLLLIFFGLPNVVFLVVLATALLRSTYGRELSLAGLDCEVNVQSVPDGSGFTMLTL